MTEARLKKMNQLKDPELKKLAEVIKQEKLAGYQELLIEILKEDITKLT